MAEGTRVVDAHVANKRVFALGLAALEDSWVQSLARAAAPNGPLRDFPVPDGFEPKRWTLHTKFTGGIAGRMYFRPERVNGEAVVLIGYVGPKLSTVRDPT